MLIERRIRAVQETLKYALQQAKDGRTFYKWNSVHCPLCKEFEGPCECYDCPITLLEETGCACAQFLEDNEFSCIDRAPVEDIAGFLTSLLISLKEMK